MGWGFRRSRNIDPLRGGLHLGAQDGCRRHLGRLRCGLNRGRQHIQNPVQPMKAIGAASVGQAALTMGLGSGAVIGATLSTGLFWLALAGTGLAKRLSSWVPRPALLGVVMGLGFSFMLEGIRMM